VRFVDDVNLVAMLVGRRVHGALAQIARVIDAAIGCGIELDDIEVRGAGPDTLARLAGAARLAGRTAGIAVERHRQNARRRGLSRAARARKQVAMGDASLRNGTAQGGSHVVLDDEVGELLRTILARQGNHENVQCRMSIFQCRMILGH